MRRGWSWLSFEFALLRYDPVEWLVLTGDRLLVSLLQVLVLAGALSAVMISGLVPLVEATPVLFLLFALIAANFTLIAIVTSLGQFVVGRRLESPGEVRSKIGETLSYREAVGETIDRPILPVKPDVFVATRVFQATFIESEVSELVRYLLYVGLPVQVTMIVVTLLYSAPTATPLLSPGAVSVIVPAVLVAGFTPFLVLSSYIVRLSVVARRTADTFPFSSKLRRRVMPREVLAEPRSEARADRPGR